MVDELDLMCMLLKEFLLLELLQLGFVYLMDELVWKCALLEVLGWCGWTSSAWCMDGALVGGVFLGALLELARAAMGTSSVLVRCPRGPSHCLAALWVRGRLGGDVVLVWVRLPLLGRRMGSWFR